MEVGLDISILYVVREDIDRCNHLVQVHITRLARPLIDSLRYPSPKLSVLVFLVNRISYQEDILDSRFLS